MAPDRCQVCGRRKALDAGGVIIRHHHHGNICLGSYSPPFSVSSAAIIDAIDHWTRQDERCHRRYEQHRDSRANFPLPAEFWQQWSDATKERARLIRRLQNAGHAQRAAA